MTAAGIIDAVREAGADLWIDGDNCVHLTDRRKVSPEIIASIRERLDDLRAVLRERMAAPSASDAVLAAARLLRMGEWAAKAAPCAFPVGGAGETCRRCNGSFASHHEGRGGL